MKYVMASGGPGAQNLIQPINNSWCTAGYKNEKYRTRFGFSHYGCDYVNGSTGSTTLYSLGSGKVLEAGYDVNTGNTIIIQYGKVKVQKSVGNYIAGQYINVVCRMWHLNSISVSKSALVTKDTVIGHYGNTGKYCEGAHLHIEFDTDLAFYQYSPSFMSGTNGGIIRGGTDSSISPGALICTKNSPPDNQTSVDRSDGYGANIDWNFIKTS